jgi:hypothetical protein
MERGKYERSQSVVFVAFQEIVVRWFETESIADPCRTKTQKTRHTTTRVQAHLQTAHGA